MDRLLASMLGQRQRVRLPCGLGSPDGTLAASSWLTFLVRVQSVSCLDPLPFKRYALAIRPGHAILEPGVADAASQETNPGDGLHWCLLSDSVSDIRHPYSLSQRPGAATTSLNLLFAKHLLSSFYLIRPIRHDDCGDVLGKRKMAPQSGACHPTEWESA